MAAISGDAASRTGLLILRLAVAVVLLVHGVPKLGNPGQFIGMVGQLGVPLPEITGALQIGGEVGLGLVLLAGVLTRVAGALVAVMMATTWLVVHVPHGLLDPMGGISGESAFLLSLAGVVIAFVGGGGYSVDAAAAVRRHRRATRVVQ